MRNARVSECVLVQALMPVATRSRLFDAIARELPEREAERAWALVVVHAVAATLTAWAPEHVSPMRKSALAVERAVLTWLADHWRERARGEDIDVFAKRYAESFSRLAEPR